jgi:hypothetical protein
MDAPLVVPQMEADILRNVLRSMYKYAVMWIPYSQEIISIPRVN